MKLRTLFIASMLVVSACNKQADDGKAAASAPPSQSTVDSFRANPDFGGVQFVSVEAEGIGPEPGIAALHALDAAIAQVNGRRVSSATASGKAGATIDVSGLGRLDIRSSAYVDQVVSASDGAVRSFSIVDSNEVEKVDSEEAAKVEADNGGFFGSRMKAEETSRQVTRYWKVKVKAEVAKFVGPKDDGRPSIVVAMPRYKQDQFPVGDTSVNSSAVATEIRSRLSDALTQTGRFQVLDREFGDELQSEVEFINSGNARKEEVARLGQRLATDLILVPTIEQFAYPKSSRTLRLSGRELTSYSGGGRLGLRLINASTGEVVMSESFDHHLPPTGPSTLPRNINGPGMVATMMDALSGNMSKAIIRTIFPVSVIQLNGDQVVLSQGGKSVAAGDRYDAVILGDELKDPQTGRSLGRNEQPCCVIRIERVAAQTSYGAIEGGAAASVQNFKPGMIELRGFAGKPTDSGAASNDATTEATASSANRPTDSKQGNGRRGKPAGGTHARATADNDQDW